MSKIPVRLIVILCVLALLLIAAIVTGYLILSAGKGMTGNFRYMILLGAKVNGSEPSPILQDRIDAAYAYLAAHEDVICIVSCGKATDERVSEAQCMYDRLTAMGISPDRLWLEDKAINTKQNIRLSMALIEEKTGSRPTKLGVLSSEYHLFRASLFAKACGVEFVGIPAKTSRPSQAINHFMREVAGVWHYILLGGNYD